MPTKRLPRKPDLAHLKHQADDLLAAHGTGDPALMQRLREFHPRFSKLDDSAIAAAPFSLSDAQLAIAREYGFASWPRLKAYVQGGHAVELDRPMHERIDDAAFRRAVDLIDAGATEDLRLHLKRYPALAARRVEFEGGNYFRNPGLLEFIAENPVRRGVLPSNTVEVAKALLHAGAGKDRAILDSALGLVASGRVPRECGLQRTLIELLCSYGADPQTAMLPALLHGEFEAVDALVSCGAAATLASASALGDVETVRRLLPGATDEERLVALALAAQHRREDVINLLLDAGADPNRFTPAGGHTHSTPLHQAALTGDERIVRILVDRGARTDIRDIIYGATPAGWADHAGHKELAESLRQKQTARTSNS